MQNTSLGTPIVVQGLRWPLCSIFWKIFRPTTPLFSEKNIVPLSMTSVLLRLATPHLPFFCYWFSLRKPFSLIHDFFHEYQWGAFDQGLDWVLRPSDTFLGLCMVTTVFENGPFLSTHKPPWLWSPGAFPHFPDTLLVSGLALGGYISFSVNCLHVSILFLFG